MLKDMTRFFAESVLFPAKCSGCTPQRVLFGQFEIECNFLLPDYEQPRMMRVLADDNVAMKWPGSSDGRAGD